MKQKFFPSIFLVLSLFVLLNLRSPLSDKFRSLSIGIVSPIQVLTSAEDKKEISGYQLENLLLQQRIEELETILEQETEMQYLLTTTSPESDEFKDKWKQRKNEILKTLELRIESVPARVIFRSPGSWSNTLWIQVGQSTNKTLGREVVARNSPVVLGNSLVGVIDYVDTNRSRVCLITHQAIKPSVRACRKGTLLAKGEVSGSSTPLWRSFQPVLHGIGFNYDVADEEGPARDLWTGMPAGGKGDAIQIIQLNDLLVTTGLDGIFPPGLQVGTVSHIGTLREGDFYYEIQAIPAAQDLNQLSILYVLPPLQTDPIPFYIE